MRQMTAWCWVLAHLAVLSAEDIRRGTVSLYVTGSLGAAGMIVSAASGRIPAVLPGLLLLAAGYLSGERIGMGDGFLILALGSWMETPEILEVLGTGCMLAACGALGTGRKEIPLVPFLTAAYVLRGWR